MPQNVIEEYKLGKISVTVSESDQQNKVIIEATDHTNRLKFEATRYDYDNYNRLMNQKIRQRFEDAGKNED